VLSASMPWLTFSTPMQARPRRAKKPVDERVELVPRVAMAEDHHRRRAPAVLGDGDQHEGALRPREGCARDRVDERLLVERQRPVLGVDAAEELRRVEREDRVEVDELVRVDERLVGLA
jgi:hypothetical protein